MRLGVSAWRLQGPRTGLHRYLLGLVRYWSPGDVFERITLYTPTRLDLDLPTGIDVEVLAPPRRMLLWENLELARHTRDDVLFCPSHSRPLAVHSRTVVTMHDALFASHPEVFSWPARLVYHNVYRASARRATLLIVDSHTAKDELARHWRIARERIHVVELAPADHFTPIESEAALETVRKRYVCSDRPFFLFVGKTSGRRDVPRLIEAFARLKTTTHLPHLLVLAGPIDSALVLPEHVVRTGYVPDEDLNALYNAADVYVMPAVYENVSLPVLEAQAAGTPVICIDTPGMREMTGGAAALVERLDVEPLAEMMAWLAEDEAARQDLRARGFANAARYSWQRASAETMAVLEAAARR